MLNQYLSLDHRDWSGKRCEEGNPKLSRFGTCCFPPHFLDTPARWLLCSLGTKSHIDSLISFNTLRSSFLSSLAPPPPRTPNDNLNLNLRPKP